MDCVTFSSRSFPTVIFRLVPFFLRVAEESLLRAAEESHLRNAKEFWTSFFHVSRRCTRPSDRSCSSEFGFLDLSTHIIYAIRRIARHSTLCPDRTYRRLADDRLEDKSSFVWSVRVELWACRRDVRRRVLCWRPSFRASSGGLHVV